MKRMLINATQPEELRVALVDGQRLYDLDIESGAREQKKANIYRGRITRIEPSLEAAFVDFGAERHGFLPLKEISREYFTKEPSGRPNIKEVLKEGQEVIVQVDKEERGNKGAALTTFISLAGRFLVLMPNNPRAGGISRRIEGDDRAQLKDAMGQLTVPDKMGVIVRTAGIGRSPEELQWDMDYLVQVWEAITEEAGKRSAPFLIYRESNVIIRAMRDYLRHDIGEVLIDSPEVHEEALHFIRQVMPSYQNKIKLYADDVPLFSRFQIESQIETAYQREVKLPSGGAVVIDHTEALVSIDINSARATRGSDIEETALQTNLEAADEIARQLRLRDIGGLVVIDFIDMTPAKNQREVENRVRDALKLDRARVQIGRISRFGLMEMSRQRLRPSLGETSGVVCPRCNGQGTIRDVRSISLSIMRLIEEEAMKERSSQIRAILPVPVATYLLNEKRSVLNDIEQRQGVQVVLLPNPDMDTPHYDVQRLRDDQVSEEDGQRSSFELPTTTELTQEPDPALDKPMQRAEAAVKSVAHNAPAPTSLQHDTAPPATPTPAPAADAPASTPAESGLFSRLVKGLGKLLNGEDSTSASKQSNDQAQQSGASKTTSEARRQRQGSDQSSTSRSDGDTGSKQRQNDDSRRDAGSGNGRGGNRRRRNGEESQDRQASRSDNRDGNRSSRSSRGNGGNGGRNENARGSGGSDKGRQDTRSDSRSDGRNATKGGNKSREESKDAKTGKPKAEASSQSAPDKQGTSDKQTTPSQDDAPKSDGKPKRTRNNPRQRSRKHAVNPNAVAEQEKLQAQAQQEAEGATSTGDTQPQATAAQASPEAEPTSTAPSDAPAAAAAPTDEDESSQAAAAKSSQDAKSRNAKSKRSRNASKPARTASETADAAPQGKTSADAPETAAEAPSQPREAAAAAQPADSATSEASATANADTRASAPAPSADDATALSEPKAPRDATPSAEASADETSASDAPRGEVSDSQPASSAATDEATSTGRDTVEQEAASPVTKDEAATAPATPSADTDKRQDAASSTATPQDDTLATPASQPEQKASTDAPAPQAEPTTPAAAAASSSDEKAPAEVSESQPQAEPKAPSDASATSSEEKASTETPAPQPGQTASTEAPEPQQATAPAPRRRRRAHNDPREQRRLQENLFRGDDNA
ncbi:ribonuclease E [Chromohalobacter israelensis]|uniref:ribonuclease E n=1 Tax=Chromohalobacter israelensis TaxID=141390 RepID=UPI0005550F71|nr:ribonuclease E [Chromohalobacter israelensis]MDF9434808.1 ribonuclease E [Chromohalobacter israelensis]